MSIRPNPTLPTAKILVVEDEPMVRELVSSQLEDLGYEATVVASGAEALKQLALDNSFNFDLLFTDVVMPGGLNGVELARRVRRAFGSDLKVLLTSSYPREALEEADLPNAGRLLLRKPYRIRDLEKAIEEALAPHPWTADVR